MPQNLTIFLTIFIISFSFSKFLDANDRVYFDLGEFALCVGNTKKARQYFKKALNLSPENPLYLQYLGKTDLAERQYKAAQKQFVQAQQLDPELIGLAYDLATTHFFQKEYPLATSFYERAIVQDSDAVQTAVAYYRAGMAYFHCLAYEKAIVHLLEAAERSHSFKDTAYFVAGICFYHQQDWDFAKNYLKQVRVYADNRFLRRKASQWIDTINRRQENHRPFHLFCRLGIGFDDNIRFQHVEESDAFVNTLFLHGQYHLVNRLNFKSGVGYAHFKAIHFDSNKANLIISKPSLYALVQQKDYKWTTELAPAVFWLDSDQSLNRFQCKSRISINFENIIMPYLLYSYTLDNHFINDNQDGNRNGIGMGVNFLFDPDFYQCQTLFTSEKVSSSHRDYNYDISKAKVTFNILVHPKCVLNFMGSIGFRIHEHVSSLYHVKRDDKLFQVRLGFRTSLIYQFLNFEMQYQWLKNNSNIPNHGFKKNMISCYTRLRF